MVWQTSIRDLTHKVKGKVKAGNVYLHGLDSRVYLFICEWGADAFCLESHASYGPDECRTEMGAGDDADCWALGGCWDWTAGLEEPEAAMSEAKCTACEGYALRVRVLVGGACGTAAVWLLPSACTVHQDISTMRGLHIFNPDLSCVTCIYSILISAAAGLQLTVRTELAGALPELV